jgi:hypothetical protein
MEAMAEETKLLAQGTMMDSFFLQTHTDLSLRLIGGNTHNLTEGCIDEKPWMGWSDDSPSSCSLI